MQKDGGWAWIIVAAAFIISFVCDGIRYSYGILYLELLKEFGQGKGPTAWIGSIMFGLQNVSGIGFSMMMLPLYIVIVQYFDRRKSLAMGLAFTGSGIGTIVFNPMSKWLIDVYGWRGTLLIQAGIVLNCVVCGLLMRPVDNKQTEQGTYNSTNVVKLRKNERTESSVQANLYSMEASDIPDHSSTKLLHGRNDTATTTFTQGEDADNTSKLAETDFSYMQQSERQAFVDAEIKSEQTLKRKLLLRISKGMSKSWSNLKALIDIPFCVHLLAAFLAGFSYNVPFTYVPDLAVVLGHGRTKAATMMAAVGISSTVSRVLSGMIADCSCVFRPYMMLVARCLIGLSTVLLPLSGDFVIIMSMCVLLGVSTATRNVLEALVFCDLFGERHLVVAVGVMALTIGVASWAGVPLAGFLFDITGRYEASFITAGVCMLLSGILVGGVVFLQWLRRRRK